jgi:hypothetical protein
MVGVAVRSVRSGMGIRPGPGVTDSPYFTRSTECPRQARPNFFGNSTINSRLEMLAGIFGGSGLHPQLRRRAFGQEADHFVRQSLVGHGLSADGGANSIAPALLLLAASQTAMAASWAAMASRHAGSAAKHSYQRPISEKRARGSPKRVALGTKAPMEKSAMVGRSPVSQALPLR